MISRDISGFALWYFQCISSASVSFLITYSEAVGFHAFVLLDFGFGGAGVRSYSEAVVFPSDSRIELNPSNPSAKAVPKLPFTQVVSRKNAFLKQDFTIKSFAFTNSNKNVIFFSLEEVEASCYGW